MKACIVLNGLAPTKNFFLNEVRGKVVVAADGGLALCKKYSVTPDYIIGDFDSVSKKMLARFKTRSHVIEDENQDTTDFQKALKLCKRLQAREISVLGGFGKDADHEFANVLSLPENATMKNETTFALLTRSTMISVPVGSVVSVIAVSNVTGLNYSGLQWQAPQGKVSAGWIGIRNRAVKKRIGISTKQGRVAVIVHSL